MNDQELLKYVESTQYMRSGETIRAAYNRYLHEGFRHINEPYRRQALQTLYEDAVSHWATRDIKQDETFLRRLMDDLHAYPSYTVRWTAELAHLMPGGFAQHQAAQILSTSAPWSMDEAKTEGVINYLRNTPGIKRLRGEWLALFKADRDEDLFEKFAFALDQKERLRLHQARGRDDSTVYGRMSVVERLMLNDRAMYFPAAVILTAWEEKKLDDGLFKHMKGKGIAKGLLHFYSNFINVKLDSVHSRERDMRGNYVGSATVAERVEQFKQRCPRLYFACSSMAQRY